MSFIVEINNIKIKVDQKHRLRANDWLCKYL